MATTVLNIYCDESCHLERDHQRAMVLGALSCPAVSARDVAARLREIKVAHGFSPRGEMKWGKASPGNEAFYHDVIDFFLAEHGLRFRALIVPDKAVLNHANFPGQDHDTWYYKMYFVLLRVLIRRGAAYRIFLDIKDTRSATKAAKLHDVLCSSLRDFARRSVETVQHVRSHEVEQIQLADILIGAISSANRPLTTSKTKLALMDHLSRGARCSLTGTTGLGDTKLNLLRWIPGGQP